MWEDLGVIGAGLRVGRAAKRLRIARIDERLRKERPSAAVKISRRNDVVAGLGEVQHRIGGGRLARGDRQSRSAAFQRRDAGLERVPGWVLDAGVDVAQLLKREEPRSVPGVLELVGGRLVDRHRDRAADWIGAIGAAMQRQSLKSQFVLRHIHCFLGLRLRVGSIGRGRLGYGSRIDQVGVVAACDVGMGSQAAFQIIPANLPEERIVRILRHSARLRGKVGRQR